MPTTSSTDRPRLDVLPAEGPLAPTLLVDGVPIHDRRLPFAEVLGLADRAPDVVAIFGVGLGYPVAGALQLCPATRVVAWDPVPGVARAARRLLAGDWKLDMKRVALAEDLADFEAALLAALDDGTRSLAVVELPRLAGIRPAEARAFRAAIRDAVDARTLGAVPDRVDPDFFGNLARATDAIARTPAAGSLAGKLSGVPLAVVDRPPSADERELLGRIAGGALVWASLPAAPALRDAGLPVDLLLVGGTAVPREAERSLAAGTVLLLPPGAHPDWWEVPCRGRLLLGHTAAAWLFPPGDVAGIVSLAWGSLLPLAVTALHAGAGPLWILPRREPDPEREWNRLDPELRVRSALSRMALGAGRALIELSDRTGPVRAARDPRERFSRALAEAVPPGPAAIRAALRHARRGILRLGTEARLHREEGLLALLPGHLARRAAADPFARIFLAPGLRAAEGNPGPGLHALREGALGFLDWMERHLPSPPPSSPGASRVTTVERSPVTVFLAAAPGEEIPARVLMWALDRRTDRVVRIRRVLREAPARLGELFAGLPRGLWFLAAAALLEPGEHGIYLEPSVLLLDDVGNLWDLDPAGRGFLVPAEGDPQLARLFRRRGWNPRELLAAWREGTLRREDLHPGGRAGGGPLPGAWSARDRADLATSAARMTCRDWYPWRSPFHPLAWLWEFQFLAACEAGYLSPRELRRAVERGELRPGLADLAGRLRSPLLPGAGRRAGSRATPS